MLFHFQNSRGRAAQEAKLLSMVCGFCALVMTDFGLNRCFFCFPVFKVTRQNPLMPATSTSRRCRFKFHWFQVFCCDGRLKLNLEEPGLFQRFLAKDTSRACVCVCLMAIDLKSPDRFRRDSNHPAKAHKGPQEQRRFEAMVRERWTDRTGQNRGDVEG